MTDTTKKEPEAQEDELIPVETPPEEKPTEEPDGTDEPEDTDGEDDHDEGDERLGESEDGEGDDEKKERRRSESKRRREAQRRAREAKDRQLAETLQTVKALQDKLDALEGNTVRTTLSSIDERINKAARDAEAAERIEVEASIAGNSEDVLLARRVKDAAIGEVNRLFAERTKLAEVLEKPKQTGPTVSADAERHGKEWLAANSWYDPAGSDQYSAVTKAIDVEIAREGYNPNTREYWQELTRRAGEAIRKLEGDNGAVDRKDTRRKGPPTGGGREHAPPSTRSREIYVTPERKQAMVDAGVWDDPAARQRYLKAYQEYDKNSAR